MSEDDDMRDDETQAERTTLAPATVLDNGELPSFRAFLAALGDGEVEARLTAELKEMAAALSDVALASHNAVKVKGKLAVSFEFSLEKGLTDVTVKTKSDLPRLGLPRSVMWITQRNNFSGQNPKQMTLWPPRPPAGGTPQH